jgi:tetraacyldisaccharide 4'-kinase
VDEAVSRLLAPFGHFYGAVTARRMRATPDYHSRLPVICVGNFTVGGSGKTPTTIMIAQLLADAGHRPAVLSRGYGGRISGPHAVDVHRNTARDVGDEPLLIARSVPVFVARDRPAGARAIEADARGFSVILMDDGLQNPSLAKDLVIAVVDGRRGFGNGRCIPAGPLRAPLVSQLRFVHAVLVNGGAQPAALNVFAGPVLSCAVAPAGDLAWLREKPLVAYAGIAAPERFFNLVEAQGGRIVERVPFADHHAFTPSDAERLLALARDRRAQLVTTEKDVMRLLHGRGPIGDLRAASRTLPIRVVLTEADQARLRDLFALNAARL